MTKSDIQSILGAKTVSFNSLFAKATGSVTAGVFLSQAIFWQEKAKFKNSIEVDADGYFSKTADEWYDETGLSTEQQKTARVNLVRAGILQEKRAGIPAKMFFKIDIEALVSGISVFLNTGATVSGFSVNRNTETPRTVNGHFRKQETGISVNSYNKESLESKESKERDAGASDPLSPPFQKIGEIEIPNSEFSLKANFPPPPIPGAPLPAGGAIRVTLSDPELPGTTIVEELPAPKTPPEKSGRTPKGRGTAEEIKFAERIIGYLNEKAGRSFRVNAGDNAKGIIARMKEGFTEADMIRVIEFKTERWGKDPAMYEHLNPVTLFRPLNFEKYLQAAKAVAPKPQPISTGGRSTLNGYGGDPDRYNEKQIF